MITQVPHHTGFESLDPDKALQSRSPSGEAPKIFVPLARFCSVRRFVAAFYITVSIILFTAFVLSKDSFDEHHTIFDSVAVIQTQPIASSSKRPEASIPSTTPPPQKQEDGEEDTPLTDGIIIRHPFSSSDEEPRSPQSPPTPAMMKDQIPPSLPESPVPGPSAVQLHTGFAPSWANSTPREHIDPSSSDLPKSSGDQTTPPTGAP
jgi:hypothetical protein